MQPSVGLWSLRGMLAVTVLALSSACAPGDAERAESPERIVVFAASVFANAFEELAREFTTLSDVHVVLNLAGSQTLVSQILEGAQADVLVTADDVQMGVVAEAGLLGGPPVVVATNMLAIAVEVGNPLGVSGLADLERPDLVVVLPAEEVPAGRFARAALAAAGVQVAPASFERSVRAALGKVAQGEADVAIVFASDVAGSDGVTGVPISPGQNVSAVHVGAVLAGGSSPRAAEAFVDLLLSEGGRAVLVRHGFGVP